MRNRAPLLGLLVVAAGATLASGPPATAAPMFMGLGTLPGGEDDSTYALGVSADGSVVVGHGKNAAAAVAAFRWRLATGIILHMILQMTRNRSRARCPCRPLRRAQCPRPHTGKA